MADYPVFGQFLTGDNVVPPTPDQHILPKGARDVLRSFVGLPAFKDGATPTPAAAPVPAAAQAAPAIQPAPAVSQNMPLPPDRFTPGPLTGVKVLEGVRRNSPVEEAVNPFKGMARIDAYNLIKQRPTQRPLSAQDMLTMKLMGLIENRASAQGSPQAGSDYMFEHLRNMYARDPRNVTLSDIMRGGMPRNDEGEGY